MKWRVVLFLLALSGLCAVLPAAAHPADQHQLFHAIALSKDGVKVALDVAVAPLLAAGMWKRADSDGDKAISPTEAEAWAAAATPLLQGRLDESTNLTWRLDGVTWPATFDAMQGGEPIALELTAAWPVPLSGEHRLTLTNDFDPKHSASWFAMEPSDTIDVLDAEADRATRFVIRFEPMAETADGGQQTADGGQQAVAPEARSATLRRLTDLLETRSTTPGFYALALAVALALGALHALTPGHGKTVVAAYLVGSHGTSLHAVSLGAVTTLTHTGSVLLLGLVALLASRFIVPNDLFPVLEVASGVLIILLGANLLYRRWYEYRSGGSHGHSHSHKHDHSHVHNSDHGHDPDANHDHDHTSHHDHDRSAIPESGQITRRSLLLLGISGGMVPCPDAIAILLLAIAIQRIGLGLALIVSFSLGLAVVLIAIGLAMLHSRRLFARMSAFERVSPVLPMVSAAIVLLLGVALTARAL